MEIEELKKMLEKVNIDEAKELDEKNRKDKEKKEALENWIKKPIIEKLDQNFLDRQIPYTKQIFKENWIIDESILDSLINEYFELYFNEKIKNIIEFMESKGIQRKPKREKHEIQTNQL